jgi:hypothetical protein
MSSPDDYMREQAQQLAQHLRLNDGKSGYVEAEEGEYRVYVRRKWPGKQIAEWDGVPGTRMSAPTRRRGDSEASLAGCLRSCRIPCGAATC